MNVCSCSTMGRSAGEMVGIINYDIVFHLNRYQLWTLTVDIELDLLLDGVAVAAVEAVVGGADVDAAVVAGGRRVPDREAAHALRPVRHLATLLK